MDAVVYILVEFRVGTREELERGVYEGRDKQMIVLASAAVQRGCHVGRSLNSEWAVRAQLLEPAWGRRRPKYVE